MPAQDPTDSAAEPPLPGERVEAQALQVPGLAAPRRRRWKLRLGFIAALLALAIGIPQRHHALRTVSTDDAYASGDRFRTLSRAGRDQAGGVLFGAQRTMLTSSPFSPRPRPSNECTPTLVSWTSRR